MEISTQRAFASGAWLLLVNVGGENKLTILFRMFVEDAINFFFFHRVLLISILKISWD